MAEERRQAVAEHPVGDDLVAIAIRSEWGLRVVDVEKSQALEPEAPVEILQGVVERLRVGDIDP